MAQLVLQKLPGGSDLQCARRNYPTQATTWTLWSYGACISLAQRAEYEFPRRVSTPNVCSFMSQAQSNPNDIKAHKLCNLNCV